MRDIIGHSEESGQKWFDRREGKAERKVATLVITADKGLAGGYNHSLIRFVEESCPPRSRCSCRSATSGKRYFIEKDYVLVEDFAVSDEGADGLRGQGSRRLRGEPVPRGQDRRIPRRVYADALDRKARARYGDPPPARNEEHRGTADGRPQTTETYRYEPSEEGLFDALVPQYLKGIVYGSLVSAFASEQAARMTAMDAATKNADEMLGRLLLHYNRARQAAITSEVSEIVAGAAALED